MRVEIPTCKRCCFCIPLRHGITMMGYLNLFSTLMIISPEVSMNWTHARDGHTAIMYKGVFFYCQLWFGAALYITEIIFSTLLIIGAHTKKTRLLRVFYYYNISTTVAILVIFLSVRYEVYKSYIGPDIFEWTMVFCILVFHINLLLLIRSELKKTKSRSQMTVVNYVAEIRVDEPLPEGPTSYNK